ncbi:synembryn [Aphelenchoides avenae]|nr:synembryn [Aphelenchus avenae]
MSQTLFSHNLNGSVMANSVTDCLTSDRLAALRSADTPSERKLAELEHIRRSLDQRFAFPELSSDAKKEFGECVCELFPSAENAVRVRMLEVLRFMFRDANGIESLVSLELAKMVAQAANLAQGTAQTDDFHVTVEADKCLINALFHSQTARKAFEEECVDSLSHRIDVVTRMLLVDLKTAPEEVGYITLYSEKQLEELLFLDLRVAFICSAHSYQVQHLWVSDTAKTQIFLNVVRLATKDLSAVSRDRKVTDWLNEAFKILFNTYCHAKMFDADMAQSIADECGRVVRAENVDVELKQNAINVLATMPLALPALVPKIPDEQLANVGHTKHYEGYDMRFVDATLVALESRLDALKPSDTDLLGTFFTVLISLCKNHKEARRYCRLKVLPPLHAKHVERPPNEGKEFRNKIVRVMTGPATCCELASEFLFVLCKRSVSRLMKYTGFGHSAGLLANHGLLGSINETRRASDSEDSETDDYKEVEDRINPVTGYIQPPRVNPFEGMSEEQKEYEAVRLANAMSKLMDEGVFSPGTIGEDGRPRAVSHVAELIKDHQVKEEEESDED